MGLIDCSVGDSLHFGDDIRAQFTGHIGGLLYVFIGAKRAHALEGSDGFHASAMCRGGCRAHVLALCDHALCDHCQVVIGPVCVQVQSERVDLLGAQAVRDLRLRIDAPMSFTRATPARVRYRLLRRVEDASCWS